MGWKPTGADHNVASHSDTTATGAELETLTDGSETALHSHAGGAAGLVLLTDTTLGADGIFTFSSISGAYRDLIITGSLRDDAASTLVNSIEVQVGNGSLDTGSNYSYFAYAVRGNGSATVRAEADTDTKWKALRNCIANSAPAGTATNFEMTIHDYTDTTFFRNFLSKGFSWAATSDGRISHAGGQWENSADVIDIIAVKGDGGGSFKAGSRLRLYGRA